MALYRIYIDEVGNHDFTHADDPNLRQSKYHRNWHTGRIEGYGKKLLPQKEKRPAGRSLDGH